MSKVNPDNLTTVADEMAMDPKYSKTGNVTHCNLFVSDFAERVFTYTGFVGKVANDIVDVVRSKVDGWGPLYDPTIGGELQTAFSDAQDYANEGGFVLIGLKIGNSGDSGGHVVVVVPGQLQGSAKWAEANLPSSLPIIAQAGAHVFSGKHLGWGVSPESYSEGEFVVYSQK